MKSRRPNFRFLYWFAKLTSVPYFVGDEPHSTETKQIHYLVCRYERLPRYIAHPHRDVGDTFEPFTYVCG